MPELLRDITEFTTAIKNIKLTIVHFSADWVEQCIHVNDLLDSFSKQQEYSDAKFCTCQAEDLADISLKYNIEAVPTIIIFQSGEVIGRVDGADAVKITNTIKDCYQKHGKSVSPTKNNDNKSSLEDRLKKLTNKHNVMLFMKGNRDNPRCGFSKQIINILNDTGAAYDTFDILTDEEVRQGLKTFSDWPTYPQLYVKGELIGGLDIVKEMLAGGELESTLNA